MEEILFIGPIANMGGPAIKNKILIEQLHECANICVWNTYDRSFKVRVGAIVKILFSKNKYIIIAVSRKGRNLLYPVVLLKNQLCKTHFSCIAIGGQVEESFNNSLSVKALHVADLVTVETKGLMNRMNEKFDLKNLYWMPNYKKTSSYHLKNDLNKFNSKHIKFMFLSSMRNLKGVKTLIDAFSFVKNSGFDISVDFYGPIKKDFDSKYLEEIKETDGMRYCGEVNNNKVLDVMNEYHVFIFPTEYPGEGFPAVLVEALTVGLPIIASDVNYNREIVEDTVNGFIYSKGNVLELSNKMKYCCLHREELKEISKKNEIYAKQYNSKNVINSYCDALRGKGWPI